MSDGAGTAEEAEGRLDVPAQLPDKPRSCAEGRQVAKASFEARSAR